MSQRLQNLRDTFKEHKLDGILISSPENRRYLSGFTGSAGNLIITRDDAILATDFRYIEQSSKQAPGFRIVRTGPNFDWFNQVLAETGVTRLGFESDVLTVAQHLRFSKALKEYSQSAEKRVRLVVTSGITEEIRSFKDENELALLQKAISFSDRAMDAVTPGIQAGQTEQEVAWRLEVAMRELGAESLAFDIIVGSGPNAALPHHRAGERVIQEGEPIVIDMGAKYEGYCSDLTRTIALGAIDDTFRRVYDTVLGAQLTAISTVQVGMTGADADGLARKVIQDAGYGENFGHSLGHGVGLAVHELPVAGPASQGILKEGTAFTIEPGIYIPGWGGVRIEDVVTLEKSGARVMSTAKKLDQMGD